MHPSHWLLAGWPVLPACTHLHRPTGSWAILVLMWCLQGERERRQPTHTTVTVLPRRREFQIQQDKELQDFETSHTHLGLCHGFGNCRIHRFNHLCPPQMVLNGYDCSWVSHGMFTSHDRGAGSVWPVVYRKHILEELNEWSYTLFT